MNGDILGFCSALGLRCLSLRCFSTGVRKALNKVFRYASNSNREARDKNVSIDATNEAEYSRVKRGLDMWAEIGELVLAKAGLDR